MGFFGTLKKVVNIATLGQVTLLEKQLELGGKVLAVTIDVSNEVVRIGNEVFRAVPGEVFYPGLGPLAGLLKNEVEDELILLNPLGLVPSITVYLDAVLAVGQLFHVVQHRTMGEDELQIVRHVFGTSLSESREVILTNLAGFGGRPFTMPTHTGGAAVHLGRHYIHSGSLMNMPLLIHELTHVWQIRRSLMAELFICNGALEQIQNEIGESVYDYQLGDQWSTYGLEQQAHIVEDWARSTRNAPPMILGSPLFRYLNGNVRSGDNDAQTAPGGSLRTRLSEANAAGGSLRQIHPPRPQTWW